MLTGTSSTPRGSMTRPRWTSGGGERPLLRKGFILVTACQFHQFLPLLSSTSSLTATPFSGSILNDRFSTSSPPWGESLRRRSSIGTGRPMAGGVSLMGWYRTAYTVLSALVVSVLLTGEAMTGGGLCNGTYVREFRLPRCAESDRRAAGGGAGMWIVRFLCASILGDCFLDRFTLWARLLNRLV